jgi:hypothetical protein
MKKIVRIGTIEEQDRWRRDDLRAMSPTQRVSLLLQLQNQFYGNKERRLQRVARIKRNGRSS